MIIMVMVVVHLNNDAYLIRFFTHILRVCVRKYALPRVATMYKIEIDVHCNGTEGKPSRRNIIQYQPVLDSTAFLNWPLV